MPETKLTGKIVDSNGDPVADAIIEVTDNLEGTSDRSEVVIRETDSSGEFEFKYHPEGDSTVKSWHVVARDDTEEELFNAISQPRKSADLLEGLAFYVTDSKDQTVAEGETLEGQTVVRQQANSRFTVEPNARVVTKRE